MNLKTAQNKVRAMDKDIAVLEKEITDAQHRFVHLVGKRNTYYDKHVRCPATEVEFTPIAYSVLHCGLEKNHKGKHSDGGCEW